MLNAFVTNPEGDVHHLIGYGIAALVALRIFWGFFGTTHARFRDFKPSLSDSLQQVKEITEKRAVAHAGHSPLGALMIYNLLLTIIGISITGYMMTTLTFFGVDWVQQAHETLVTWAEISVFAHVSAVLIESRRLNINLIKTMISGYKDILQ
jgi:cytochrome b